MSAWELNSGDAQRIPTARRRGACRVIYSESFTVSRWASGSHASVFLGPATRRRKAKCGKSKFSITFCLRPLAPGVVP